MLVNRSKIRVGSIKGRGWALCVKGGISVEGFPQKVEDTKELKKIIRLHRDLIAKRPYLLPPWSDPGWSVQGRSEAPGDLNRRHSGGLGIRLRC
jgi:hypothetical protein